MLLKHSSLSLEVPIGAELLPDATKLAADFANESLVVASELELLALFVHHCSTRSADIAIALFNHLSSDHLPNRDVYSAIQELNLDEEQARNVLKGYYSVWSLTEPHGRLCIPSTLPALFSDPDVSLMALFGGQGGMENYVDEARWLLDVFCPLLNDYVDRMTAFLCNESRDPRFARLYKHGMDVAMWCADVGKQPQDSYLLKPSVAIPSTGLLQLMHLMILYKTLGINPGDLTKYFKVAVGHSQGTVAAVLLASVTDEESFYALSEKALGILMLVGAYSELECLSSEANYSLLRDSISHVGLPLPMVSIRGIRKLQLAEFIAEFNADNAGLGSPIYLSLVNTHDQFVVSGIASSLAAFVQWVHGICAQPGEDQARIPFSKRKPSVRMSYLTISRPYHCELLRPIVDNQLAHAVDKGWIFNAADLAIEVRASSDGHDIRHTPNLTQHLFECTCALVVDFPAAIGEPSSTHIVDFSPGGFSTFGTMAYANVEGRGVPVISTSALTAGNSPLGTKAELFKQRIADVLSVPNWQEQFAPRLVRTAHDSRLHIDTPMHRVLGQPPLMVAGMMPTTVNEHFVAAIKNAGYHAELGGAGIYNEQMLKRKFDNLIQETAPGQSITLNCIYLNQRLWNFQYAELLRLRREGYPIAGVCIGAGVPSLEVANEILRSFRDAGIQHVAFKPGTATAIRQVLQIAQTNPDFPVILQWTGGRAGGHHSCEDFHEPLLETYSAIRSHPNIVLVLGSGFGDAEGTLPYLTGDWSLEYGRAPMPADGFLFASRVMVAKEAGTSTAAKELITQTSGLADDEWEKTYSGAHGGVITAVSEYGELVHAIATRGAILVKELHDAVLSKPRDQQPALLNSKKDHVIRRLNADYVRPWFGRKADGSVCDIEDMTYMEVASRLAELLYVRQQQRWIDPSYLDLFFNFMRHIENRFADSAANSELQSLNEVDDPNGFACHMATKYPDLATTLISSEDIQHFVLVCKQKGTKPVPFIPLFDEDFSVWLLKDTAWQLEDVESLVGEDVQRALIPQGPVSTRHSTTISEPVKDILDGIYSGQTSAVLDRYYSGDISKVPIVDYIGAHSRLSSLPCTVPCEYFADRRIYHFPADEPKLPALDSWISELCGPGTTWLSALLTSRVVVKNHRYVNNRVCKIIQPRPGQTVTLHMDAEEVTRLVLSKVGGSNPEVEISVDQGGTIITVCIYHVVCKIAQPWEFNFTYHPEMPSAMIHELSEGRDRQFCLNIASGTILGEQREQDECIDAFPNPATSCNRYGLVLSEELVAGYCESVGNSLAHYERPYNMRVHAPMDLLCVIASEGIFRLLSAPLAGDGILHMVQKSNSIKLENSFSHLQVGDTLDYSMRISAVFNTPASKQVEVHTTFRMGAAVVATMCSIFLFPGIKMDTRHAFRCVAEPKYLHDIKSSADISTLLAKEWFVPHDGYETKLAPGNTLEFDMHSEYHYKTSTLYSHVKTVGLVYHVSHDNPRIKMHIADVDLELCESLGNPVTAFLDSTGRTTSDLHMFDHDGIPITPPDNTTCFITKVPNSASAYAESAGDYNPIHTNAYLAEYAGLASPIMHGVWTSASARAFIERYVAECHPERVRSYSPDFVERVVPGDQLETALFHVGMKGGRMLVKGITRNQHNNVVLTCTAEVDQPASVYTFTGQGAQYVKMGMDLYEHSDTARNVWDRADRHMLETYGVSLLNIVRDNPSELTVRFNGKHGDHYRQRYMSLSRVSIDNQGKNTRVQLFPQITSRSRSYTHKSESGLLNATQFAQPALTVFAMAHIADLKSKSLVQEGAMFAGHSLGEFGALASLTSIFSIEDIVDITFYRGILLHASVERDSQSRSQYGMAAVNPSRVGNGLSQDVLVHVVHELKARGGSLLELINYNISGQQYVVTGHHSMLSALRQVLDTMHACSIDTSTEYWKDDISNIIRDILAEPDRDITPARGRALIPLAGIDVPSHSTQLLPAVAPFRRYLLDKIPPGCVNYAELKECYIPNVTAKPFVVSKEYFEVAHAITRSAILDDELSRWTSDNALSPSDVSRLSRVLLVELLAYQFASPVLWIDIQNIVFNDNPVHRFIEVGPRPTLIGMAEKTLAKPMHKGSAISLLHIVGNVNELNYWYVPDAETTNVQSGDTSVSTSKDEVQQAPVVTVPQIQVAPAVAAPNIQSISDIPAKTVDIVQALVAYKLDKPANLVPTNKTIKDFSGGKSALQNEMISSLHKEFGSRVPDKAEDMSLGDLATTIGPFEGTPSKNIMASFARMFATKLPSSYTQSMMRSHLEANYGLGPHRQFGVLLLALTMAPPKRLTSETEVIEWTKEVAGAYATREGISLSPNQSSGGALASGPAVAIINSAEFEKAQQETQTHILRQIETLARNAGVDLRQGEKAFIKAKGETQALQTELDRLAGEFGESLVQGVRQMFDAKKARHYVTYWNWARQDLFGYINQSILEGKEISSEQMLMLQNRSHPALIRMAEGYLVVLKKQPGIGPHNTTSMLCEVIDNCKAALLTEPVFRSLGHITGPHTEISCEGNIKYSEIPRLGEPTYSEYVEKMHASCVEGKPFLHIRSQADDCAWLFNNEKTNVFFNAMSDTCSSGLSFNGNTALITGCGRGSIGSEILKGLLVGGAKVVATTSSYSHKTTMYFEDIYRQYGARGSELYVLPFNQGSVADVEGLVDHIFSETGLNWDLDFIIPFGSVSDIGNDVTMLRSHSELVLRIMMTNVMRLIGAVASIKASKGLSVSPSLVLVPLSPNHGIFGGDGFYGECKASLETLLNRWTSESWSEYLSVIGTVIGWTRGTNMMDTNDILACEAERRGTRTFSTGEMAFNILCLLHPNMRDLSMNEPVWADLSGGFQGITRQMNGVFAWRTELLEQSAMRKAIISARAKEHAVVSGSITSEISTSCPSDPLAKSSISFPEIKSYEQLEYLHHLEGMVNLDKVVVVTGYGEVGPFGHSATRWEMEAYGELSHEGAIELAWLMGLIKRHNAPLLTGTQTYVGWVDAKTGKPVRDRDIKKLYEPYIIEHTGIRLLEPEQTDGTDPSKLTVLREIQILHDMEPFESTYEEACNFKIENGDMVDIWENENGSWFVKLLKGASISIPKARQFTRNVSGHLPSGWALDRYGISDDVLNSAELVSLLGAISTTEALIRSGITDPYELFEYFHVSDIGNSTGSCVGGAEAMEEIFKNSKLDKDVKIDIMQELLVNAIAAWTNMLILSSAGQVTPTVGACATTAVSVSVAVETILSGKAKMMVAGASDTYSRDIAQGFAQVNTTPDVDEEYSMGRTPREMSRPCTATRNGFVESLGSGIVTLMSASAAIACGVPIYGIVAMVETATDKQSRSIPTIGHGILTVAREAPAKIPSPLLDISYRRRELEAALAKIQSWAESQHDRLKQEVEALASSPDGLPCGEEEYIRLRTEFIETQIQKMATNAKNYWGNEFWKDEPTISPLRGSLATWGLTIDDIGMVSFHATSTITCDITEPYIMDQQFKKLSRTPGYAAPAVCQKYLTGHPLGPAGAWMLNGAMQCIRTGIVPGNRNLDDVTPELEKLDHIVFPSKTTQTPGINAALVTSFGFGQSSGEILVLNPDYVHAVLPKDTLDQYRLKVKGREQKSSRYWQNVLVGNHTFTQFKEEPPFAPEQEAHVYMDSTARARYDPVSKKYRF